MKLQTFNTSTLPGNIRTGEATVGINFKAGLFGFSKIAKEQLGIGDGSSIAIHQDEDDPGDWYIELVPKGQGVALRENKDKDTIFFNHSELSRLIRDSFEHESEPKSAKFAIASEPIKFDDRQLYGIIITTGSFKY